MKALDLIGPKENWKTIPFPDDATKQQTVAWIIKTQERRINRLEYERTVLLGAFVSTVLALVGLFATGRLSFIGV